MLGRIKRTEPSANANSTPAVWGEKKSNGSEYGELSGLLPMRAITMAGEPTVHDVYTGAPGVVTTTPLVITPAHGTCANRAARSPTARVLLVPSVISVRRIRLLRKNTPFPRS